MSEQVKIGHYILGKTIGSGGFARVKSINYLTYSYSGQARFNRHWGGRKNNKQEENEEQKHDIESMTLITRS